MAVPEWLNSELAAMELEVDRDAVERVHAYLTRLAEVNQRLNLTAFKEPELMWRRLALDSWTALPGMPEAGAVCDVGTGGGFPGVPLAAARPDLRFVLLESTGKKARFVAEAAAACGLENVEVVQDRAEAFGRGAGRAAFDVVVCRAVGALRVILEYGLPLTRVGGRFLAMKGPRVEQELEEASDALSRLHAGEVAVFDAYPEGSGNGLCFVSVLKDRSTPARFPREPGMAKREPL